VIAQVVQNPPHAALDVGRRVPEDRRRRGAVLKRLAVDASIERPVGSKNRRAMSSWPLPRMWRATQPLWRRQANTLLSGRTAAMISGGRNDACETHVTVAAPKRSPLRDVMM